MLKLTRECGLLFAEALLLQEQISLTLESLLVVEDSGTKSRNAILRTFRREEAV